jgi:ABC-type spermidine/putrescine transport system permease subunit II
LLAINIFPLIWTIRLSFTNFRANRPNAEVLGVGIDNYVAILTDPDVWGPMQATAHFLFWTITLQTLIGFTLAYLLDRKFRGHGFQVGLNVNLKSLQVSMAQNIFDGNGRNAGLEQMHGLGVTKRVRAD